jgi:hypothetical protein
MTRDITKYLVCTFACLVWLPGAVESAGGEEEQVSATNTMKVPYRPWMELLDHPVESVPGVVLESLLWDRVVWSRDVAKMVGGLSRTLVSQRASSSAGRKKGLSVKSDPWASIVWIGLTNDVQRIDRISRVVSLLQGPRLSQTMAGCPQVMSDWAEVVNKALVADREVEKQHAAIEKVVMEEGFDWVTECTVIDGCSMAQVFWSYLVTSDADVRLDGKILHIIRSREPEIRSASHCEVGARVNPKVSHQDVTKRHLGTEGAKGHSSSAVKSP